MSAGAPNRLREGLSRPSVRAILVIVGISIVFAVFLLARMPRPVAAVGTLGQCLWGWPVINFEGEEWKAALPDGARPYGPHQMPVADWPSGMRYDETAGALLDERGEVVYRKGDRARIGGTIVGTGGGPAPCYYTLGVKVETITAP